jgi:antitoxin HicB
MGTNSFLMRTDMTHPLEFTVVLEPQPEGGFTVHVPALPEVITEGDTEAEALAMAEEAMQLAVEYRRDHNLPISVDLPPTLRRLIIAA